MEQNQIEAQLIRLTRRIACLEQLVESQREILSNLAGALHRLVAYEVAERTQLQPSTASPDDAELLEIGQWVIQKIGWDRTLLKMRGDQFLNNESEDLLTGDQPDLKEVRARLAANWLLTKHTKEAIKAKMSKD